MSKEENNLVELPALAASSATARGAVADMARRLNCLEDADIEDLCVAVGEAFANIVRHGFSGEGELVRVGVERHPDRVTVHMVYRSAPFNTVPHAPSPEEMAVGGYGLYIMNSLADLVEFEFRDGLAHLCLEKRCDPAAVQPQHDAAWPSAASCSAQ